MDYLGIRATNWPDTVAAIRIILRGRTVVRTMEG